MLVGENADYALAA